MVRARILKFVGKGERFERAERMVDPFPDTKHAIRYAQELAQRGSRNYYDASELFEGLVNAAYHTDKGSLLCDIFSSSGITEENLLYTMALRGTLMTMREIELYEWMQPVF